MNRDSLLAIGMAPVSMLKMAEKAARIGFSTILFNLKKNNNEKDIIICFSIGSIVWLYQ